MQKICIVNKSKDSVKEKKLKNKQVNNKRKFIVVVMLMMFFLNIPYSTAVTKNSNDFGRYHVYSYKDSFRYIKYKDRPQRIHEYYYINNESKSLPAYCMNLGMSGAETIDGGYDVDVEKYVDDCVVNNIVLNGYPYKTVSELGLANESEARYATQFAIWVKLNNLDINQITPMEKQYLRVVEGVKNIYNNGLNSKVQYSNGVVIKELESNDIDKLDERYYSKTYSLEYGDNVLDIDISIEGVKDYLIVDKNNNKIDSVNKNKQIKVLIPRESNSGNIDFKINIKSRYKESAVLFAKSSISGMQDLSLTLEPVKLKSSYIGGNFNEVKTNLSIIKKDAEDESIHIPNVKFSIYDLNDKLIGSFTTNEDGKIYLDVEKDLKIFKNTKVKVKEEEVPAPYTIDKNCDFKIVELKVGSTTSVEFKNNKLEKIEKIELPKTGF